MKRCILAWARGTAASLLSLVVLGGLPLAAQQASGGIRGSVFDYDFQVPLGGARVTISELQRSATTGEDGNFLIEQVPPGRYTVIFLADGYERQVVSDVVVTPGRLSDVRAELSLEVIDMEQMIVTGSDLLAGSEIGLLDIRATAIQLQDSVSSELFSKAGAGDVGSAVKLVVGASVRDGKYATIRGLSDRYTGTTLNGVRVPSPDPRRRAVQVDLFPTATVENVTVTKTFTPDLQGDFTGGGIDIQTKSIPDQKLLSISISAEHNSLATGARDFIGYRGFGVQALGTDKGDRGLPDVDVFDLPPLPVASPSPVVPPASIGAAQTYDRFTRAFAPTMGIHRGEIEPGLNSGFSVSGGNRLELARGVTVGLLGAVTYSHKYGLYLDGENNNGVVSGADSPIVLLKPRQDNRGTEEVLVGGLANAVVQFAGDQELSLRYIVNEGEEDSARFQVREIGPTTVERNHALVFTARRVYSLQLGGKHPIATVLGAERPLTIDWVAADSATEQNQPDIRFFRNYYNTTGFDGTIVPNSTEAQRTRRIFRKIGEDDRQGKIDITAPFRSWTGTDGEIKAGVFRERGERGYDQVSLTYTFPTQVGNAFSNPIVARNKGYAGFNNDDPDAFWTDVFLDPERIGLSDSTCVFPQSPFNSPCAAANQLLWTLRPVGNDVNYDGEQRFGAHYLMIDLPLLKRLRLIGGARWERTRISITPDNPRFGTIETIETTQDGGRTIVTVPQDRGVADIDQRDLLPSVGLVWEIVPSMNLRATWSRTSARPTFRELAPVATEEFADGDEFLGNPDLALSQITNEDLRWEWFRRPGEVLAVSVFHKDLTDPIEYIAFSAANRNFVQPTNFETGTVDGVELEARTSFDFIAEPLRYLTMGVNYAKLDTAVDVPAFEQDSLDDFGLAEPTRALQGQPDFIFNANISYDNPELGLSTSLFYNLTGRSLDSGGARGVEDGNPNVFEEQRGQFDFSAKQRLTALSKRIGADVSLRFRARNIGTEDEETVYTAPGREEVTRSLRETALSLSLSASVAW